MMIGPRSSLLHFVGLNKVHGKLQIYIFLDNGRKGNTASNISSVVAWLFVTAETCLQRLCLIMNTPSGPAIATFIPYVTICTASQRTAFYSCSGNIFENSWWWYLLRSKMSKIK